MTEVTTTALEADQYESALGCAGVEVVRTGPARGPNVTRAVSFDGVELVSGLVQFPVFGRTNIAKDTLAVVLNCAAPPGSRWCEMDLTPGTMLVYGPGALHTARSPAGMEYRFALVNEEALRATAESLGTRLHLPARGSVTRLNPTRSSRVLGAALDALGNPQCGLSCPPPNRDDLLHSVARVLADPSSMLRPRQVSGIVSRQVVVDCIDYADEGGKIPSIPELCVAAHVSERRLRRAFHDVFDVAPHTYFRTRLLSHARARLRDPGSHSVTEIALDLGFGHLGRFASQYEQVYGELPRETFAATHKQSGDRDFADVA